MINVGLNEETAKVVGLVIGSLVAALFGNSVWRRRKSGDGVVVASAQSEVSTIARLESEIKRREDERNSLIARFEVERNLLLARCDTLNSERNAAVSELGGLRQQVLHLSTQVEALERQVGALQEQIHALLDFRDIGMKPPVVDAAPRDTE